MNGVPVSLPAGRQKKEIRRQMKRIFKHGQQRMRRKHEGSIWNHNAARIDGFHVLLSPLRRLRFQIGC
jgi:hypothetical protein